MKRYSLRNNDKPVLMIIPMIDIIFFLLVFFMLTTIYAVPQQSMHIDLPKTQTAQSSELKPVIIDMDKSGQIFIDKQLVSANNLNTTLQHYLNKNTNQSFLIRADEGVAYGNVVELMDEMKVSKVANVSIATIRK